MEAHGTFAWHRNLKLGASDALIEKGRTAEPHPICTVQRPIGVNEEFVKNTGPRFPGLVKVAAGEEASHGVAG